MGPDTFGFSELFTNLNAKLKHPDFRNDLGALVIDPPNGYELREAADLVVERLGCYLKNAPHALPRSGD